ncbi:hypothetical protein OAS19_03315 [Altererythrobacter sp.]|nr:hypothetical protein [Altererythrobacter sp.]
MTAGPIVTGLIALLFVAIHVTIGQFRELDRQPRSNWLSFAGGIAVAYVFLHILPQLSLHQQEFQASYGMSFLGVELFVFGLALVGLALFYGLDRWARLHADRAARDEAADIPREVVWTHTGAFALYNVLIGYLLVRGEQEGGWALATYAFALGVHFVTTDHAMRRENPHVYDGTSRWVLSAAIIAGWALGQAVVLPDLFVGCMFALLGGGIILNVLKEELPAERESRALPFFGGAALYGALLIAESALAGHAV